MPSASATRLASPSSLPGTCRATTTSASAWPKPRPRRAVSGRCPRRGVAGEPSDQLPRARVLTMDVLVDTSGALENVREKYVAKIEGLLDHNEKLHAPPIVEFGWAEQVFRGVLQSLEITYLLFHIDGKPLR